MDYTPGGVREEQCNKAVSALWSIDKRLKKIGRNLTLLTLLPIAYTVYTLKNKKGE